MNGYTKPGLMVLMIYVVLALCITLATYSLYSTVHLLQGPHPSFLFNPWPITIIGMVATVLVYLGAIFILSGRKEFGENHRKYTFYAIIIFITYFVLILIFTRSVSLTAFSWITQGQPSNHFASTADYFRTTVLSTLVDSFIIGIPFGLIWVLSLYNLENKKGQLILLAAFVTMILVPIITFIGSITVINSWISQGILDTLANVNASSMKPELFSISTWIGPIGIILLLFWLLQYILMFVALYIPYKRIATGELKPSLPPAQR
jgi:hypothetical protein